MLGKTSKGYIQEQRCKLSHRLEGWVGLHRADRRMEGMAFVEYKLTEVWQ